MCCVKYEALDVSATRDLARTKFLTVSILEQKEQLLPDSFACYIIRFDDKFSPNQHFVIIFNSLVLRAQLELSNKLGYYEYVLLAKRSFPPYLFV